MWVIPLILHFRKKTLPCLYIFDLYFEKLRSRCAAISIGFHQEDIRKDDLS